MSKRMLFLRSAARTLLLAAALLLCCAPLQAQKQKKSAKNIYTRGYRIQDFRSKTTRIVLGGPEELRSALREDATSLWTLSPYEFCDEQDYEKGKESDGYFLFPRTSKGLIFLSLQKSGANPLTLISIPVCGEKEFSTLTYMSAFLSIIQDYVEAAIGSEFKAYFGLKSTCKFLPWGKKVYKDPSDAAKSFHSSDPDAAVQVIITPDGNPKSKPRHKYVFGAAEYELYSYN